MAVDHLAPPKRPAIGIPVYIAGAIALLGMALFAYLQLGPARGRAGASAVAGSAKPTSRTCN